MALTKMGGLATQAVNSARGLLSAGGALGRGTLWTADKAYKVARGTAKAGVKGAVGAGRFIEKHPKTGLGTVGAGLYASYKLPGTTKKLMAHSDPNQNYTYRSPLLGKVKYNTAHPAFGANVQRYAEDKNRFF
jgi:hypothetical protein